VFNYSLKAITCVPTVNCSIEINLESAHLIFVPAIKHPPVSSAGTVIDEYSVYAAVTVLLPVVTFANPLA